MQKLKMKICKLGDVCKQTSLLKRITVGGLGPKLQLLCKILGKKAILKPLGHISAFAFVQNHLRELDF